MRAKQNAAGVSQVPPAETRPYASILAKARCWADLLPPSAAAGVLLHLTLATIHSSAWHGEPFEHIDSIPNKTNVSPSALVSPVRDAQVVCCHNVESGRRQSCTFLNLRLQVTFLVGVAILFVVAAVLLTFLGLTLGYYRHHDAADRPAFVAGEAEATAPAAYGCAACRRFKLFTPWTVQPFLPGLFFFGFPTLKCRIDSLRNDGSLYCAVSKAGPLEPPRAALYPHCVSSCLRRLLAVA